MTVSLWKGNPNQLLIYSTEVNIYIGFWTLKIKCTLNGLYGQTTIKNARVKPWLGVRLGLGVGPGSGGRGFGFFGGALAHRPDVCNAHRRYLERPFANWASQVAIHYHVLWPFDIWHICWPHLCCTCMKINQGVCKLKVQIQERFDWQLTDNLWQDFHDMVQEHIRIW